MPTPLAERRPSLRIAAKSIACHTAPFNRYVWRAAGFCPTRGRWQADPAAGEAPQSIAQALGPMSSPMRHNRQTRSNGLLPPS